MNNNNCFPGSSRATLKVYWYTLREGNPISLHFLAYFLNRSQLLKKEFSSIIANSFFFSKSRPI